MPVRLLGWECGTLWFVQKLVPPYNRQVLSDDIPSPLNPPSGCVFRTRCRLADQTCAEIRPEPVNAGPDHVSYCLKTESAA